MTDVDAPRGRLDRLVRWSLWERVERDHRESDANFRRRQRTTATVTVVGAATLAWGLNVEPGSNWFYVATIALAAVWSGGAFLAGPLHLGRIGPGPMSRRPVLAPIVVGLALASLFMIGGIVVREIPFVAESVDGVLDYFREGAGPAVVGIAVVNAVAEELFFRGALYAAIPGRHQVAVTTVIYTLATAASGNAMLTFAAGLLGLVVGLQRRASGGILAPMLTHVTWSVVLLAVLPQVFVAGSGSFGP